MLKNAHKKNGGFALIEAMVTVVILIFGLLGLLGLQMKMTAATMESYQRAQALILVNDMAQRIAVNPKGAACYGGVAIADGSPAPACSGGTPAVQANADLAAWYSALRGVSEKTAATGGANVGAVLGARGCIVDISTSTPTTFLVTVAWQGLSETAATPVTCGAGQYKAPGASTNSDAARRTVSMPVTIATLGT